MSKRPFVTGLLLVGALASVALSAACGGKAKATPTPEPTSVTQPVSTATAARAPEVQATAVPEPTVTSVPGATPGPTVAPAPTRAAAVEATATPGAALAPVTLDELEIPDVVIDAGSLLGDLGGFGAGSVVIPTDLMGGLDLSEAVDGAP